MVPKAEASSNAPARRSASWPATFRSVAFLGFATVLPFALAFAGIAIEVKSASDVERAVRVAQASRSTVLRLQLDQETEVRGYADSKNSVAPQLFRQAQRRYDAAAGSLRAGVSQLAPSVVPMVDDQDLAHRQWVDSVAVLLMAHPKPSTAALQAERKRLVDRFRNDNAIIARALEEVAERSDAFANDLVYAIIAVGLVFGSGLLALMLWIGSRQRQLAGEVRVRVALNDRDRETADALQKALMPYDVPSVPGLILNARYRPADEPARLGGDWYDALPTPDGRILITIGDVIGHGIQAIELMSHVRRKLVAAALHEKDPGTILTEANRQLLALGVDLPVVGTAVCALIDPRTREITYASAGHPPPILVHPGSGVQLLATGDLMLGVEDYVYGTHVAQATGNALLVFYTDGLLESTRDVVAGEASLLSAAHRVAAGDLEDRALAIKQHILGNASPLDDVAVITVTFAHDKPRPLHGERTTGAEDAKATAARQWPPPPSGRTKPTALRPRRESRPRRVARKR